MTKAAFDAGTRTVTETGMAKTTMKTTNGPPAYMDQSGSIYCYTGKIAQDLVFLTFSSFLTKIYCQRQFTEY